MRDPSALAELTFRERIWLHDGDDYDTDVERVLWQMTTFGDIPIIEDERVKAEANIHVRAKNAAAQSDEPGEAT